MGALTFVAASVTVIWSFALCFGLLGQLWCLMVRDSSRVERLWRAAAMIHQELWLFVAPGILLSAVQHWHSSNWYLVFFDMVSLRNWWHFRNWPEDNNWKRRAKKAKEAVERRAGRLVVVPATGGA